MKKLVTVSLPYANSEAHVGHIAGAYLPADIYQRFQKLKGEDILFLSGSDMHGSGVLINAENVSEDPHSFALKYHNKFKNIFTKLDIGFDIYSNTATEIHKKRVHDIFLKLYKNKYIIQKLEYQPFCENEKRFLPDRYVEGACPNCENPKVKVGESCDKCNTFILFDNIKNPECKICHHKPILKKTKNFFLELPLFEKEIKKYINKKNIFRKTVKDLSESYIKTGLISRSITRDMSYGISIPLEGFEDKVIYVWFEALIGYLSISEELKGDKWEEYWKEPSQTIFFMAKDNIVFHSIILPSILLGYNKNLVLPYNIVSNEYLLLEGEKMSKSNNHSLLAKDALKLFGKDNLRFYLALNLPEGKDFNFQKKDLIKTINSTLASNIGNYINRTLTFAYNNFDGVIEKYESLEDEKYISDFFKNISSSYDNFKIKKAVNDIISFSDHANQKFDQLKIWENKDPKNIYILIQYVYALSLLLYPIIPESATNLAKILNTKIKTDKYKPFWGKIEKPYIIFPKIENDD